jgi:hypothetical protein
MPRTMSRREEQRGHLEALSSINNGSVQRYCEMNFTVQGLLIAAHSLLPVVDDGLFLPNTRPNQRI